MYYKDTNNMLYSKPSQELIELKELIQIDLEEFTTLHNEYLLNSLNDFNTILIDTGIPSSITMRQTRLYLLSLNLLDEVESFVSQNPVWKIEWEYANEVLRTNQLIPAMQDALNLTSEQVDTMFLEASKL